MIDFSSLFFQHFYFKENRQKDRDSFTSFKKDREEFCLSVSLSVSLLFSGLSVGSYGFLFDNYVDLPNEVIYLFSLSLMFWETQPPFQSEYLNPINSPLGAIGPGLRGSPTV